MCFPVGTMAQLNIRNEIDDDQNNENHLIEFEMTLGNTFAANSMYNNKDSTTQEQFYAEKVKRTKLYI